MRFIPRFLTDGSAVAVGGYVHRVNDSIIRRNIAAPSASTSLGGLSDQTFGPFSFVQQEGAPDEPVMTVGSSAMKAWNEQSGPDNGTKQTHTTHAMSSVDNVAVGKRLFIDRASAYLKSVHRAGQPQPIVTPVDIQLEGLVIDGVRFKIKFDSKPVCKFGTYASLQDACAKNAAFKKQHGNRFLSLSSAAQGGARPQQKGRSQKKKAAPKAPDRPFIVCSLVDRIEWDGELPKGAEVDKQSHVIVWPDFGKIILGEMLISDFSRRLTMVRLELGSPMQGSMAFADVQSGGQGLP